MQAELLAKKRQLEQENDDMQRREREALASVSDLTEKLDKCFEEIAWLQSELEQREEINRELIQRLRDEISEQKSELAARQLQIQRLSETMEDHVAEEGPKQENDGSPPSSVSFHPSALSASLPSLPVYCRVSLYDTPPQHTPTRPHSASFTQSSLSSPNLASSLPTTPSPSVRLKDGSTGRGPDNSPLDMVNDMLHLVKELETRLSSQRAALGSPLKVDERGQQDDDLFLSPRLLNGNTDGYERGKRVGERPENGGRDD